MENKLRIAKIMRIGIRKIHKIIMFIERQKINSLRIKDTEIINKN